MKCPKCKKESKDEDISRVYGKDSSVYSMGFCSAKCYTDFFTDRIDGRTFTWDDLCGLADWISGKGYIRGECYMNGRKTIAWIRPDTNPPIEFTDNLIEKYFSEQKHEINN